MVWRMQKHVEKKRANAYFTLEATLVWPIAFGVIVLLVYIAFFQYNRCLMEQDMGILALRGCTALAEEKEEVMQALMDEAAGIYTDKYILWEGSNVKIRLEKGMVKVAQEGELYFPFGSFNGNVQSRWYAAAEYENRRLEPVSFIRLYRKVTGGK